MAFPKLFRQLWSTYDTAFKGGQVSGEIKSSDATFLFTQTQNTGRLMFNVSGDTSPRAYLYGGNHSDTNHAGSIWFRTFPSASVERSLLLKPDGTLKWNGLDHTAWGMPAASRTNITVGASGTSIPLRLLGRLSLNGSKRNPTS